MKRRSPSWPRYTRPPPPYGIHSTFSSAILSTLSIPPREKARHSALTASMFSSVTATGRLDCLTSYFYPNQEGLNGHRDCDVPDGVRDRARRARRAPRAARLPLALVPGAHAHPREPQVAISGRRGAAARVLLDL